MKIIKISDNRRFNISSIVVGYLEENKEEVLEFEIPEKYSEYGKKACFSANGQTFAKTFDDIISNKLTITRDISQFKELDMTIAFFKIEDEDEIIARTSILHILIENAIVCDDDVKPDEPKIIVLDNLIDEVTKLDVLVTKNEEKREEYYQEIQEKVDNGDFNGATFKPSVDSEGNLSFTNDKGLDNPETVNIRGPKGDIGPEGTAGAPGKSATIQIGSVTTLAAGSQATVTNVGTENEAIFNFGIPKGEPGSGGGTGGGTTDYSNLSNKPKINNIELKENNTLDELGIQAKGDYVTTSDIPTKTSELTNDSGFITSIPAEYITESELNAKGYLTSIPIDYKTKTENDLLYQPIGSYASPSDIPTKTSDLTNDSGFITGYTETDPTVPSHVKSITELDISNWNSKSNFSGSYSDLTNKPTIPTVPTNISSFTNDAGYQTATQVQTAIETYINSLNASEVAY